MEKNIKDYLHLYLGCEVGIKDGGILYGNEKMTEINTYGYVHLYERDGYWPIDQIKPILRPLSDMSEEERKELWKYIFKREFNENGIIVFRKDRTTSTEPRYVMSSGLERLGIEMNGTIWADSDLSPFKHNQHEVTLWLLSKRFDLFGLIESGLAIDKTKNNKDNVQVSDGGKQ